MSNMKDYFCYVMVSDQIPTIKRGYIGANYGGQQGAYF